MSAFFSSRFSGTCKEMTQLQGNIEGIVSAFNAYAKEDGGCITLSKGELRQLIQQEFADVLVVSTPKAPALAVAVC